VRPSRRDVAVRGARAIGIDRLLDRASGSRGGVILAWHRVAGDLFERQAEAIARRYEVVPLVELVGRHAAGRSTAGLASFTFDDAYRDTMLAVGEVAGRRGWHVTSFVPTRAVATGELHWFSRLRVVAAVSQERGDAPDLDHAELVRRTEAEAFYRPLAECDAIVDDVRERLTPDLDWAAVDAHELAGPFRTLGWHEVRRLDEAGAVAFGPHTVHHPFLATLARDEVVAEVEGSVEAVAAHVGEVVPVLCYPYGDARAIGDEAPALARECGFARAGVTMTRGRVRLASDAMLLPRVPIYDHDDVATVAVKVATAR
jgi:peptidoglycan/xylan/chitin deacetylase (PgdA/CDA1 family)